MAAHCAVGSERPGFHAAACCARNMLQEEAQVIVILHVGASG